MARPIPRLLLVIGVLVGVGVLFNGAALTPAPVQAASCTGVTLTPSVASPQNAGVMVTWTASASGCASSEYQFWLWSSGVWTIQQPWSGAATWNWNTTGLSGDFYVAVWARESGSGSASPQAQLSTVYTIRPASGCSSVALSPSAPSPQAVGSTVTFTGAAAGCTAPQYQFWLYAGGAWSVQQAWSASTTWAWNTAGVAPGTYYVAVDARNGGSGVRDAVTSLIYVINRAADSTCTSVSLTPSAPSPQNPGAVVTFMGAAAGCAMPQYQFWRYDGSVWTVTQEWSAAATWQWDTTGAAGWYYVAVEARGGMSGVGDTQSSMVYQITGQYVGPTVTQISAGGSHSCARMSDGSARCWGNNDDGQLGTNNVSDSATPVIVVGLGGAGALGGVARISAGHRHSCAVLTNGEARCWGYNASGQLGNGTTTRSLTPVPVVGVGGSGRLVGVSDISAGEEHTCAALTNGEARCWGYNANGQLGNGITTSSVTPLVVVGVGGAGVLTGVVSISAGAGSLDPHTCAVLSSGEARCWGHNFYGQLGNGTTGGANASPMVVVATDGTGALSGVAAISAGRYHTCAALTNGEARCWGWNSYGQLGNKSRTNTNTPAIVAVSISGAGPLTGVISISAGADLQYPHSCAALSHGEARCWGHYANGQLGAATAVEANTAPLVVRGVGGAGLLTGVAGISAGRSHTCTAQSAGAGARCWGLNSNGQLGNNSLANASSPVVVVGVDGSGTLSLPSGRAGAPVAPNALPPSPPPLPRRP